MASGFSALQFAAARYSLLVGRAVDRHGARPVEIVGALVRQLATCRWVHDHHNVLITGMTGTGKSYLACALAQQACRRGYRALCRRVPRLYEELTLATPTGATSASSPASPASSSSSSSSQSTPCQARLHDPDRDDANLPTKEKSPPVKAETSSGQGGDFLPREAADSGL